MNPYPRDRNKYLETEVGNVLIKSILALDCEVPNGSMMAGLLKDSDGEFVWCLFYEQGGDWRAFLDGDEKNIEALEPWMPSAIRQAVTQLCRMIGDQYPNGTSMDTSGDLMWFDDWATEAAKTLKAGGKL